ncbi:MAG TPA: universal stress protein [Gemmatimonadales bacterium]
MSAAPLIVSIIGGGCDVAVMAAASMLGKRLSAPLITTTASAPEREDCEASRERHEREVRERDAHAATGRSLARLARRHGARLLVMGASRHTTLDQLLGRETTLHVLREADRPVLVVAPTFRKFLRRIVVAIDFGPAALRAAHEALAFLRPGGTLVLTHVVTQSEARRTPPAWSRACGCGPAEAFDELVDRLDPPDGVALETLVLAGDPAEAVVSHASRTGADLVATGMSGAGSRQRMYVGGVATSILRRSPCSVLVTPA